jgi:hypothetical protein
MTSTEVSFKDFTKAKKRVQFQIDEDVFEAPSVLPIPTMQELARVTDKLKTATSSDETLGQVIGIFDVILLEASAKRMRERVASKEEPVDIEQLTEIMLWLLEVYGLRPTTPSSPSSAGLPTETSGTPSMDGAPSAG